MIVRRFQFQLKTAAYGNDSGKRGVFARREAIPCGEESPHPHSMPRRFSPIKKQSWQTGCRPETI